jgi:hypothetical protein
MTVKIEAAKSAIVREIAEKVDAFFECNAFQSEPLLQNHEAIKDSFKKLEAEFPAIAKEAKEYYDAELPPFDEPQFEEDFGDALFEAFLSLRAFTEAVSVGQVINSYDNLRNHLFDLSTWCEGYDDERGFWRD